MKNLNWVHEKGQVNTAIQNIESEDMFQRSLTQASDLYFLAS